jgi:hypothetical protein
MDNVWIRLQRTGDGTSLRQQFIRNIFSLQELTEPFI